MLKKIFFIICFLIYPNLFNESLFAQEAGYTEKRIKNIIVMIPDGTSTPVLSLARWYQWSNDHSKNRLAVDPILCGLVKTHTANGLIGSSPATTTCYATGYQTQCNFIAMYPEKKGDALIAIDADKAYQPLITVLEAAKLSGKLTGMVFTCDLSNATPACFSAHYYTRHDHDKLVKQIIYNDIDLVFGVTDPAITRQEMDYLKSIRNVINDYQQFKHITRTDSWALFNQQDMKFDFDRDTTIVPSLAEMTVKALELLAKSNEQGFFLMIEGSRIDWAAHQNDPLAMITEYLAFDRAVEVALRFAENNEETIIVICPDHGNSGVSLGNQNSDDGYSKVTIDALFAPLKECKLTAEGLTDKIYKKMINLADTLKQDTVILSLFHEYWGMSDLSGQQLRSLSSVMKRKKSTKNRDMAINLVAKILSSRTYIGFTTVQHTGEDVFLAIYAPRHYPRPTGLMEGEQVNQYLCQALGGVNLTDSTSKYFSSHKEIFKENEGFSCKIFPNDSDMILQIRKGKNLLEIPAYKNTVFFNNQIVTLRTVTVYVDKNETFYLPQYLKKIFEKKQ